MTALLAVSRVALVVAIALLAVADTRIRRRAGALDLILAAQLFIVTSFTLSCVMILRELR